MPGVFIHVSDEEVIGIQRGKFNDKQGLWRKYPGWHDNLKAIWKMDIGTYCFRSDPMQLPFGPENIINGVSRPELWPNIWMSDPGNKNLGEVVIRLRKKARFNKIFLTFNNGLNRTWPVDMSFSGCVKTYEVLAKISKKWKVLVREDENVYRQRIHCFEPVVSGEIKIQIRKTHGSLSGQIFEVRIYDEKA